MTELQHRFSSDNSVIKAAPHPKGEEVNPKEYYMVDPPNGNNCGFLAHPGITHRVFYTASFRNDARIDCHALEDWRQTDKFVGQSISAGLEFANTPEQLVAALREKADKLEQWLEKNPQPPAAAFQGMPYAGMKVWVEHPGKPGTLVCVKVTEIGVVDGDACVITEGWKYFRPGHWFWTEEAAKASLQDA